MKVRHPSLKDLPLELILRVLPFEECLLSQPLEISLPWLNFMGSKRCYRLLGESGIGNARCGFKFELEMKYGKLIYINYGKPVDSKYLKQYIIFDAEDIGDFIYEYPDLLRCMKVWTGDFQHDKYIWLDCVDIESNSSRNLHDVVFTNIREMDLKHTFKPRYLFDSKHSSGIQAMWLIDNLRYEFVSNLKHVEIDMSMESYTKFRDEFSIIIGRHPKISPKSLHIYLKLDKYQNYPQNFPIEWVTSIFNLQSVEDFSLHYYEKSTYVAYLSDWIEKMPHLKSLNLGFGIINFTQIPRQIEDAHHHDKTSIQVKVDKKYFNSVQHKYNRCHWHEKKFKDCVIVYRPVH
ncbi:hypothetical protein I9W82_003288 [Candida metapsilosis]|uniref:Uncharacterized protein n=1 Tax=Candida metapsilosis TaxID=273372 RepID=A0A8H7ZIK7_9ASCO|nr:hypothetical protein I9W82_003288 [Candida metapsilosis]